LGEQSGLLARQVGARAIVSDQRNSVASLLYYWRDQPEPVLAWPLGLTPIHQFELTRALSDATPLPLLFVSHCASPERLSAYFADVQDLGLFQARSGPTSGRMYQAFKLDRPRRPLGPLGPCA
jgi:hypothetical protein